MSTTGVQVDLRSARNRLRNALPTVPGVDALLHWLDGVPTGTVAQESAMHLSASVSANIQRISLYAWAAAPALVARTARFLAEAEVSETEMLRFAAAFGALEPDRVGSWIEIGPLGIDGGWIMPGPIDLQQAQTFLPPGSPRDNLLAWARRHDISNCLQLRRAVGEQAAYSEVLLPMPAGDPRHQMAMAMQAIEAMGAEPIPLEIRQDMLRLNRGPVLLSAWLVPDGLAKVGVQLPGPAPELQTLLLQAIAQPESDLDLFTAALGANGPDRIEIQELASGLDVELHFDLSDLAPTD